MSTYTRTINYFVSVSEIQTQRSSIRFDLDAIFDYDIRYGSNQDAHIVIRDDL
ncbi:MAG TPA: hypothetical protein VE130_05255 [Nitrososphaeraceae archaeon]|nr:hypothetical protein [Nitrososphaeraceae archaeon]